MRTHRCPIRRPFLISPVVVAALLAGVWSCAGAGSLLAASSKKTAAPPQPESGAAATNEFRWIQQAVADGILSAAESRAGSFLKEFQKSPLAPQIRVWQAECQLRLGRPSQTLATLKGLGKKWPPDLADAILFLTGEAHADLGQFENARDALESLLKDHPASPFVPDARLTRAWFNLSTGKTEAGWTELDALVREHPLQDIGQLAAVKQGEWLVAEARWPEAKDHFRNLLASKPGVRAQAEAELWLGELLLEEERVSDARRRFRNVTGHPVPPPARVLERAWMQQGECEMRLQEWDAAREAFERVVLLSESEQVRLRALRRTIAALRAAKRLAEGLPPLQKALESQPDRAGVAACLVAIGEAHVRDNNLVPASTVLSRVVDQFPQTPWAGLALRQLAEVERLRGNIPGALELFQRAATENPNDELAAEAEFRQGSVLFSSGRLGESRETFLNILEKPGARPFHEPALVNALLTCSRQGDLKTFEALRKKFAARFPDSMVREQLYDERAWMHERQGDLNAARAEWKRLLKDFPETARRPRVLLDIGRTLYQDGLWADAIEPLDDVVAHHDESPVAVEAQFLAAMCRFRSGRLNQDDVIQQLRQIVDAFPQAPEAGWIQFTLGQVFFEKEDFANAQAAFLRMARTFPKHRLAEQAMYFAGLSAARRADWEPAKEIFQKAAEDFPDSPRRNDALLGYAEALRKQERVKEALAVYQSILERKPQPPAAVLAHLGLGDCHFALGGDEPNHFNKALEHYDAVLDSGAARVDQRNEAGWRRARIFHKLNRDERALEAYLDVVYGALELKEEQAPEFFWFGKSVVSAGRILEAQRNWRGALAVYRLAEQTGGPDAPTWRERRLRLQREHFIYD